MKTFMTWSDFLVHRKRGAITIVGAGGKTALMFHLARSLSAIGQRVLTTTTTRITQPRPLESPFSVITGDSRNLFSELRRTGARHLHFTAAWKKDTGKDHLIGYPPEVIDTIWKEDLFDWIIVEGDGAFQKPIKAPSCYEPVIPRSSHIVIGVIGLSAIGRPLNEKNVHRSALFSFRTGCPMGAPVTEDTAASILSHPLGTFKGSPENVPRIVFLNQTEIPGNDARGEGVTQKLLLPSAKGQKRNTRNRMKIDAIISGSIFQAEKPFLVHPA